MESQEHNPKSWRTRIISYTSRYWVITVVVLAFIIVLISFSNSRYKAGYQSGAGEGAVYKPLYEQAQVDLDKLRKQHNKDLEKISDQNGRIRQLEGRKGFLKPSEVTQNQAEETLDIARKEKNEADQQLLENSRESREIGETSGRLKEIEKSNQQLTRQNDRLQWGVMWRNFMIFALLVAGIVAAWFYPKKPVTSGSYAYSPVVPTSAITDLSSDTKSLEDGIAKPQESLPEKTESSSNRTDSEKPDDDFDDTDGDSESL